jgi:ketosteroid isomerase-like protein
VNSAASPEDLHKLFVQALNSGDLDELVALYAFDGFLMARSGPARGISAIRKALADYVAMKPMIQLTTRKVVQVEDTALLVGRLSIPRNHPRWRRCVNLWYEHRSRSSPAEWELVLLH